MTFDSSALARPAARAAGQGQGQPRRRSVPRQVWDARWCYVLATPALVLTAMFTFWPTVASWYFSLLQWSGFTNDRPFIGLDNYRELINDDFFWNAFGHSFLFLLGNLPIRLTLALLIAVLLNDQALKLAPIFRTCFFIPVVTTEAIVGIVMTFLFSPLNGPINQALVRLGLIARPVDFLGNPDTALWTVVAVSIWKWLGVPMIYWLAALQTIPKDLYEAAKVDGSGWWASFRHITIPLLIPFAVVIVLITAVNTLNVFALVQSMTEGGPFFASDVIETYIFRTAFGTSQTAAPPRLGYASAAGVFFGITVFALVLLQVAAARRANAMRRELTSTQGGA